MAHDGEKRRDPRVPLVLRVEVQCSSGTYVRSLAADLGRLLGGGAHLRRLRRTAVGSFTEADAAPPDEARLLSPAEAMRDYERITVDEATAGLVAHGRVLPAFPGSPPWALVDADGSLLAVYEAHGEGSKPAVVLVGG
jgi:tRNA pseudouridine55 synthase